MPEDNFDSYIDKASELKEMQLKKMQVIKDVRSKVIINENDTIIDGILKNDAINNNVPIVKEKKEKKVKKEKKPITPIIEEEVEEEVKEEKKEVIIENSFKEDLILKKLAYIEANINSLIELLPEVINKSITDFSELQQKFAVLENNLLSRPITTATKSRRIILNRDANGKIVNADLIEGE